MIINYVLLAVTGLYSIANIISLVKGRGWLSNRMFGGLIAMILFVLVLIATIMGVDYQTFRHNIESSFMH